MMANSLRCWEERAEHAHAVAVASAAPACAVAAVAVGGALIKPTTSYF